MRIFNPEKELSKIKNGNKKKIIISICALLVVGVLGYSFALYQVRHTQKLVFNTVGEFKKRDIILSVLVDGKTQSDFPPQGDEYVFDNIVCDRLGTKASFNSDTWELTLTTKTTNKCTVKFISKPYTDGSGANYSNLYEGLIPIKFDEQNKMYIADYKKEWYNYTEHKWANAVLIDHTNPEVMKKFYTNGELNIDKEIAEKDVLQMYVWIPRYKYELFNTVGTGKVSEQMINIQFEKSLETSGDTKCNIASNGAETCTNAENGKWYTHPAFTFGETELRGIWVGKFEPSGTNNHNIISDLKIIPNATPLDNISLAYMFQGSRDIELKNNMIYNINPYEIDSHLMKNIEWGAVAYLTQSKYGRYNFDGEAITDGAEIWKNNTYNTGCSGNSTIAEMVDSCSDEFKWTKNGVHASTTNNVSGIYDMSGSAWEYIMGNMVDIEGTFYSSEAQFGEDTGIMVSIPSTKYYDKYTYGNTQDISRGHLGDATKETRNWYEDYAGFPFSKNSWTVRGGRNAESVIDGIFNSGFFDGYQRTKASFRVVITAQDGVD